MSGTNYYGSGPSGTNNRGGHASQQSSNTTNQGYYNDVTMTDAPDAEAESDSLSSESEFSLSEGDVEHYWQSKAHAYNYDPNHSTPDNKATLDKGKKVKKVETASTEKRTSASKKKKEKRKSGPMTRPMSTSQKYGQQKR